MSALSHEHTDAAQSDDTERLAVQLDSLPAGPVPTAAPQVPVGLGDVAGLGQQECDRVLGGRQHVRLRRVHDHHAPAGGRGNVHVVETDAGPADHDQVGGGGEHLGRHRRRAANDQRGRVVHGLEQLVGVEVEALVDVEPRSFERLDPTGCDLLGDEDAGGHQCFSLSGEELGDPLHAFLDVLVRHREREARVSGGPERLAGNDGDLGLVEQ